MNLLLRPALVLAFLTAVLSASAQSTVFYGGDPDGAGAVQSSPTSRVFDDFRLTQTTLVTGLFGDFEYAANGSPTSSGLSYEIRSGVSAGNGGTLVGSGTLAPAFVSEGVAGGTGPASGYPVFRASVSPIGLTLGPGIYYLGLAFTDSNRFYSLTTNGANAVGSPIDDGDAFLESSTFAGGNYEPTTDAFGSQDHDFSIGVLTPTPEPSALAALGLGAVAVLTRRLKA